MTRTKNKVKVKSKEKVSQITWRDLVLDVLLFTVFIGLVSFSLAFALKIITMHIFGIV